MPHLIGDRIVLREYRKEDLPSIRNWVNDPDITDTLSTVFTFPQSEYDSESFLNMMMEGKSNSMRGFVIADKAALDYIGQIDLIRIDWQNRSASLGIVIGRKDLLGQGIGREAIHLLKQFVFQSLNLNRLELEVYDYNERAYRCYRSCGFQEEGRLRKKIFKNGSYHDVIMMSVLADEN
ncbi:MULTISPECIES: GNAT family N-acetyltransferase [unclassified Paenibacillus]|uniref:GNAT family N-acetyltransferase n=1 Tax=unclassified Paenibacillus TaxID=185978 RepID=UPI0008388EAE|nr:MULTISPECIES: GNAT family protein [unclassified Paenibacillus]NWL89013.1 N-acetyltransferase [Paenibacillus sp. 79R4]